MLDQPGALERPGPTGGRHLKSGYSLRGFDVVGVIIASIAVISVVSTFVPWRCHVLMCLMHSLMHTGMPDQPGVVVPLEGPGSTGAPLTLVAILEEAPTEICGHIAVGKCICEVQNARIVMGHPIFVFRRRYLFAIQVELGIVACCTGVMDCYRK